MFATRAEQTHFMHESARIARGQATKHSIKGTTRQLGRSRENGGVKLADAAHADVRTHSLEQRVQVRAGLALQTHNLSIGHNVHLAREHLTELHHAAFAHVPFALRTKACTEA
jgi:hypothetical protein